MNAVEADLGYFLAQNVSYHPGAVPGATTPDFLQKVVVVEMLTCLLIECLL